MNNWISIVYFEKKYYTNFWSKDEKKWTVESYLIEPLEVMVDWIEKGILPKYTYR